MRYKTALRSVRMQACQQQASRCIYCEYPIWYRSPQDSASRLGLPIELVKYSRCTAEHLVAKQGGGNDSLNNIAAACAWCNEQRHSGRPIGAPGPIEYKEEVRMLVVAGIHPIPAAFKSQALFSTLARQKYQTTRHG